MSLNWKVHAADGELLASCRHSVDAAAIVAAHGDGTKIKYANRIVFTEHDGIAGNSYDEAAECARRMARLHALERYRKMYGHDPPTVDVYSSGPR